MKHNLLLHTKVYGKLETKQIGELTSSDNQRYERLKQHSPYGTALLEVFVFIPAYKGYGEHSRSQVLGDANEVIHPGETQYFKHATCKSQECSQKMPEGARAKTV